MLWNTSKHNLYNKSFFRAINKIYYIYHVLGENIRVVDKLVGIAAFSSNNHKTVLANNSVNLQQKDQLIFYFVLFELYNATCNNLQLKNLFLSCKFVCVCVISYRDNINLKSH